MISIAYLLEKSLTSFFASGINPVAPFGAASNIQAIVSEHIRQGISWPNKLFLVSWSVKQLADSE